MASIDEASAAGRQAGAGGPADLPAKAAAQIEAVVEVLRDKSVRPVFAIVQGVIFGLVCAFMLLVIVVLLSVVVLRLLDTYAFPGKVWASYTVLGGIFSIAGLFLLSRRNKTPRGSEA